MCETVQRFSLGRRELCCSRLGRREHDGSRLRSITQLQVARRGCRSQQCEGTTPTGGSIGLKEPVGPRLRWRKFGAFRSRWRTLVGSRLERRELGDSCLKK